MTIRSSTSADTFMYINPSLFTTDFSISISFLMPVVQNMTKLFYIEKSVTCAYNIIALMYTQRTL